MPVAGPAPSPDRPREHPPDCPSPRRTDNRHDCRHHHAGSARLGHMRRGSGSRRCRDCGPRRISRRKPPPGHPLRKLGSHSRRGGPGALPTSATSGRYFFRVPAVLGIFFSKSAALGLSGRLSSIPSRTRRTASQELPAVTICRRTELGWRAGDAPSGRTGVGMLDKIALLGRIRSPAYA